VTVAKVWMDSSISSSEGGVLLVGKKCRNNSSTLGPEHNSVKISFWWSLGREHHRSRVLDPRAQFPGSWSGYLGWEEEGIFLSHCG
jgi:hypothetical protein